MLPEWSLQTKYHMAGNFDRLLTFQHLVEITLAVEQVSHNVIHSKMANQMRWKFNACLLSVTYHMIVPLKCSNREVAIFLSKWQTTIPASVLRENACSSFRLPFMH